MSADAPDELKGWPLSWYKDKDENSDLQCPVSGCNKVFRTANPTEEILTHAVNPVGPTIFANEAWDLKFRHKILLAMFTVRDCPKCPDPSEIDLDIIPDIPDPRTFFAHEEGAHGSQDLSDVNKFIGLIREYREKGFGGGAEIWPDLYEYSRRRIIRHKRFLDFQRYVQTNYDSIFRTRPDSLTNEHFNVLAERDRGGDDFGNSEESREKYRWCYPVKSDEFLSSLGPLPGDPNHILNVMKRDYSAGEL